MSFMNFLFLEVNNAATLACCETPEIFCGHRNFTPYFHHYAKLMMTEFLDPAELFL